MGRIVEGAAWAPPYADMPLYRGYIVLIKLDPVVSPGQNKTRPCVVVGNDGANATAIRTSNAVVAVLPLARTLNKVVVTALTKRLSPPKNQAYRTHPLPKPNRSVPFRNGESSVSSLA